MTSSFKRWQRVDLYMLDMVESECVGACMCVTLRWQYRNQSYQKWWDVLPSFATVENNYSQ